MNENMERDGKSNEAPSIRFRPSSSDCLIDALPNVDAGIVWERLSIGYRIVDLGKNRFDEALELAKEQFFTTEPMCMATIIAKDKISMRTYLDLIAKWIKEMRSMCAIHEGTGKLVGIAVATVNSKADQSKTSSRIRISQGEAIFKIQTLKSCVFGIGRIYEKYEIDEYLRLHVLCVDSGFRNRGIGTALVRSCVDCYRRLELPACIGAFSSGAAQTIADRLGFETLADIPYGEYVAPEKTEKPFTDAGPGNYSIACMACVRRPVPTLSRPTSGTTVITPSSKKEKKKRAKDVEK